MTFLVRWEIRDQSCRDARVTFSGGRVFHISVATLEPAARLRHSPIAILFDDLLDESAAVDIHDVKGVSAAGCSPTPTPGTRASHYAGPALPPKGLSLEQLPGQVSLNRLMRPSGLATRPVMVKR
jgi:hypothetical protein